MIRIEQLSVWYQQAPALDELSLHVAEGECVLLTGPSGCGKSTLGRVVGGLIPHAIPARLEGRVTVAGLDLSAHAIPTIARRVGMVFQRPAAQLFHLRVDDEVAFGPRNLGMSAAEVDERTAWALHATNLYRLRAMRPAELSGGQRQCLAIAIALAMQPQVLVLDEPTASLDGPNTRRLFETLAHLRSTYNITLLLIEHRLAEAAQLAERVLVMEAGRIVADETPAALFAQPEVCQRIGLRRPADERPLAWVAPAVPAESAFANAGLPLLDLQAVSAGFHGQAVLHDISLQIYPGEFVALVGDNGAGKSTLALLAAGLIKPQRGRVRYAQRERPRPGQDVALLFQDPPEQLFTDSVDEEVAFGGQNYACFDPELHAQILQEADLLALRQRRPLALSLGQQQRTALAACLGLRPQLLILDEPTLGQDWGHLQRLMNYLRSLNRQGMAILLISHDETLVQHYAQRVIWLKNGRIERNSRTHNSNQMEIPNEILNA